MGTTVSNSDNIIDSRDVENKIDELEQVVSESEDAVEEAEATGAAEVDVDMDEVKEAKEQLAILQAFKDEAANANSEWDFGATFISENYFETYAKELAEDIGDFDPQAPWPMSCIDWAEAAGQLQQDYSTVDFDGTEYFVLST